MKFTGERMIPEYNKGEEIYLEHITRYMFASQFVKNKTVLDIACGSGYGSDYLLKSGAKNITGVDISEETINFCKEKYSNKNIDFLVGNVEEIPLKNKSVDIIVSFETIEHVNEEAQINFLLEVKRVLNNDGVFIVSTPNSLVYPKGNPFHLKELNPREFEKILRKNFKNIDIFYQDDVESSYIYSENNLKNLNKKTENNEKIDNILPEKSMYLIAVCSDIKIENITEYVGLSNMKPYLNYINFNDKIQQKSLEINIKEQIIQSKVQEIDNLNGIIKQNKQETDNLNQTIFQKDQEINALKNSTSWKITYPVRFIKDKFIKIKSLALYFFKKSLIVLKKDGILIFLRKSKIFILSHFKFINRVYYKFFIKLYKQKKEKGLISVIIPIYDRTWELEESIESILNQTYKNFELILVTDGSPQETMSVVEKYRNNPKVKIFHFYNNTGNAVRGRNKAIKEANGEFIAFQDSDDIAEPDRLEKSIFYMRKYKADIVYGGWRALLDGTRQDINLFNGQEIFSPECDLSLLSDVCVPCQSTVMVNKKALYDVGGLKSIMQYREDHELWLRLSCFGYKFKSIPNILTNLRLHKDNNELKFKNDDVKYKSLMLLEYKKKTTLPKKIVYVIPGTSISGGIAVILNHANGLIKRGYDVSLISQNNTTSADWFPNQQTPIIALKDITDPKRNYVFENIDILVATHWTTLNTVLDIDSKRKIYFVQSDERNFEESKKYKKDVQKTYEYDDKKIEYMTMAKWIKKWLKDEFNYNTYYVPNGLDIDIFHPINPIEPKSDKIRVLLEGPINIPFKGMADAFEVVKNLDCEVWAISSYGKPEPNWKCDRFFEGVNLFDMPAIYSSCDILLKMSKVESFAYPPLEMMACGGVPVILDVTGIEEYAKNNKNCIIVKNNNEAKEAILKLISDKKFYNDLKKSALETAQKFNWDKSIVALEGVMKNEK